MEAESGKWTSKTLKRGDDLVVELDGGMHVRAIVMMTGGWSRGPKVGYAAEGPTQYNPKTGEHRAMMGGGGPWVAIATCKLPDLHKMEQAKKLPDDETLYTDWRPNFVTGNAVVRTFASYVEQETQWMKDRAERRADAKTKEKLLNAAVVSIYEAFAPGMGEHLLKKAKDSYTAKLEVLAQLGMVYYGNDFEFRDEGILRLAQMIQPAVSGPRLDVVLNQLRADNAALRARMEAAEEKVAALRFIVNS
jgi:hypothetical protein